MDSEQFIFLPESLLSEHFLVDPQCMMNLKRDFKIFRFNS